MHRQSNMKVSSKALVWIGKRGVNSCFQFTALGAQSDLCTDFIWGSNEAPLPLRKLLQEPLPGSVERTLAFQSTALGAQSDLAPTSYGAAMKLRFLCGNFFRNPYREAWSEPSLSSQPHWERRATLHRLHMGQQ